MKKIRWIIICISCVIFLGSCQTNSVRYELMQDVSQIISIQIAEGINERDALEGNYDKLKVMVSIPKEQWEMFLAKFQTVPCSRYRNDPCQSLEGNVIWITYADGALELIGDSAAFYQGPKENDSGDFLRYYFNLEQFNSLIGQYIKK